MDRPWDFARGLVLIVFFAAAVLWIVIRTLKKSIEPGALLSRLIITVVIVVGGAGILRGAGAFTMMLSIPIAVVLALVWVPSMIAGLIRPLTSLFDGGDEPMEAKPYYSVAEAKRKRGLMVEARAEVHNQLAKFPGDFQGQMMLAEMEAQDFKSMEAARMVIEGLARQPGLTPAQIAGAWNALADWHLKNNRDLDGAREALGNIVAALPESQFAQIAQQRLARLSETGEAFVERPLVAAGFARNIGLRITTEDLRTPEASRDVRIAEYVGQLELHPADLEAREKLAALYAESEETAALAEAELERLAGGPHQTVKKVAQWLNSLADLQVRSGRGVQARATVQQIIDRFPGTAPADMAVARLAQLNLEIRGQEKRASIPLPKYQKDLGLRGKSPLPADPDS